MCDVRSGAQGVGIGTLVRVSELPGQGSYFDSHCDPLEVLDSHTKDPEGLRDGWRLETSQARTHQKAQYPFTKGFTYIMLRSPNLISGIFNVSGIRPSRLMGPDSRLRTLADSGYRG